MPNHIVRKFHKYSSKQMLQIVHNEALYDKKESCSLHKMYKKRMYKQSTHTLTRGLIWVILKLSHKHTYP